MVQIWKKQTEKLNLQKSWIFKVAQSTSRREAPPENCGPATWPLSTKSLADFSQEGNERVKNLARPHDDVLLNYHYKVV